jgi:hypothetical protein
MTFAEQASFIRERLKQLEATPPSGSRFDQMLHMAESGSKPTGLRGVQLSQQTVKDVQEMHFILRTLFAASPSRLLTDTLRKSLKDDPLPVRSGKSADGRNAQAELYAGAILQNAGLNPEKDDPPDYRFAFDGVKWALEVKRLQSENRLEQRIREGFDALGAARATGLLLLDVSQALRSHPSRLVIATPGPLLGKLWARRLTRLVDENCSPEWLRDVRRGREIRGLIFLDHFVVPDDRGEWCLHSFAFGVCMDERNMRRQREFNKVFAAIERGTATPANRPDYRDPT